MTRVREKIIAHCPQCHKRTAWLHINGVRPFWLCLICAMRAVAPQQEVPPPREAPAGGNIVLDAVGKELAHTDTALDQTPPLLPALNEACQRHRASAILRLKLTYSHRRAVLLGCRAAQAIEAARQIRQDHRALVACVRAQRYKGDTLH